MPGFLTLIKFSLLSSQAALGCRISTHFNELENKRSLLSSILSLEITEVRENANGMRLCSSVAMQYFFPWRCEGQNATTTSTTSKDRQVAAAINLMLTGCFVQVPILTLHNHALGHYYAFQMRRWGLSKVKSLLLDHQHVNGRAVIGASQPLRGAVSAVAVW